MAEVTVRELRNEGGQVLDRVVAGETLLVTRDGTPVAELRPIASPALDAATLLDRWRRLPQVDPQRLREDIDSALDPAL
jgi:prevent-host-death family protein